MTNYSELYDLYNSGEIDVDKVVGTMFGSVKFDPDLSYEKPRKIKKIERKGKVSA
ncbi:hypothetical protein SAMN05444392_102313 [Seinonella peptonophila]|uniref:Uncharacterized protein n=1 Tax=Seinonella peptonophila TaxID=112248 RepID=A0A1M4VDT8_9BACL|nr:hypothetical protein [Seinonella peptonophila]SHE67141.1 hypothetical protein SAMN05444392_102313 [Seinonella peptonophila]